MKTKKPVFILLLHIIDIQTFNQKSLFFLLKNNLCEFTTRQIQNMILYSRTDFKRSF